MKRFLPVFLLSLLIPQVCWAVKIEEVNELYIEARGHNIYEAKIKALDNGMRRGFMLLASKLLINDPQLMQISYEELKQIFKNVTIRNEVSTNLPSSSFYSAIVKFSFRQTAINQFIQKYGSQNTKNKFFSALIIPIFKIGHNINVADATEDWSKTWLKYNNSLNSNKLYLPAYEDIRKNFTSEQIFKLNYEHILEILPFKLYKEVILPVAEYFTNRQTGASYLQIRLIHLTPNNRTETVKNYDLPNSYGATKNLIFSIVDQLVRTYGRKTKMILPDKIDSNSTLINNLLTTEELPKEQHYSMLIDSTNKSAYERCLKKLHSMKAIKSVELKPLSSTLHNVIIYTDVDQHELAENFYLNGLSYYTENGQFFIIEQQ